MSPPSSHKSSSRTPLPPIFDTLQVEDIKLDKNSKGKNILLIKFPWMNRFIDPEKECQFCMTYENSACEPQFDEFKLSLEDKKDKKTQDALFDKMNECAFKHASEFLPRMELIQRVYEDLDTRRDEVIKTAQRRHSGRDSL